MSTLLSAVLTQHLAWVATVTPAGGTPAHTYQDKHTAKWVMPANLHKTYVVVLFRQMIKSCNIQRFQQHGSLNLW